MSLIVVSRLDYIYSVKWNSRDQACRAAAAGTYFCRLQAGGKKATGRMMLIK